MSCSNVPVDTIRWLVNTSTLSASVQNNRWAHLMDTHCILNAPFIFSKSKSILYSLVLLSIVISYKLDSLSVSIIYAYFGRKIACSHSFCRMLSSYLRNKRFVKHLHIDLVLPRIGNDTKGFLTLTGCRTIRELKVSKDAHLSNKIIFIFVLRSNLLLRQHILSCRFQRF